MIIANQISKSYGDTVVIDGVSVSIPAGGVTSIIGPNGAGKSTLLSIVARLMSMDAGTVTVDGLDVTKTASDTLAKRLSILRQDNHISSRLTVRDLVGFGRYPYSKGRPTIEDKVHIDRALEYLHLEPLAGRFLDELSGGQRQRAFVAMVLCQDTDYVLLDEPLNNLDMKHASSMMKIMRKAADELKRPWFWCCTTSTSPPGIPTPSSPCARAASAITDLQKRSSAPRFSRKSTTCRSASMR